MIGRRKSSLVKPVAGLLLIFLVGAALSGTSSKYQLPPLSEATIIRLLQERVSVRGIIQTVEARGVAFQLSDAFAEEIGEASKHLSRKEASDLMSTIRDNFREPAAKPFRVSYRLLKGHAVDLLLDKKIDKEWDEVLSGKYYILPNDVLTRLSRLRLKFSSREFEGEVFSNKPVDDEELHENLKLAKFYSARRKPLFVGSAGEPMGEDTSSSVGFEGPAELIPSLNDPNEQWRLIQVDTDAPRPRKGAPPPTLRDIYTFRKFASKRDIDWFAPLKLAAFYSYITRDYLPPDFAIIEISVERVAEDQDVVDGCDTGPEPKSRLKTYATLLGPLLSFNVAIIENVSNQPMSTGRFFFKENKTESPRTRAQDRTVLDSQPFQKGPMFSPGILKPGEKLVVPLELSLTIENDGEAMFADSDPESADDPAKFTAELARVRQSGGLKFPGVRGAPRVKAESIERMLTRPKIDYSKTTEYLYGPSISIENMEIDSYGYLVRHFDPKKLLITRGGEQEGGSCPFVYSYSTDAQSWLSEGVILYGNSSKIKEANDEILLKRFDGRILIREKDPEHSFVDMLQIKAIAADGSESIIRPKNVKLLSADGQYVELDRGQELLVDFDMPPNFHPQRLVLQSAGYYLPYNLAKKTTAPRNLAEAGAGKTRQRMFVRPRQRR